ncbi:hypothetical protein R1521_31060 [Rhizobium brockwellii]|uniref:Uncharacterized protein n=1 Tax=Rhizobium brockwellii TaxID=3019932 RepID=A0ABU3YVN4_9HYPH|nr:hypothetical protein [Rhizobium brockwellii]MDV4182957.1 hypothetical protein [Rhizobium brockwellii]MDV4189861.1 hypothetical protein [Rhizobium brockwellii]
MLIPKIEPLHNLYDRPLFFFHFGAQHLDPVTKEIVHPVLFVFTPRGSGCSYQATSQRNHPADNVKRPARQPAVLGALWKLVWKSRLGHSDA